MNLKSIVGPLAGAVFACGSLSAQDAEDVVGKSLNLVKAQAAIQGCTAAGISGQALLVERPSDEGVKLVDVIMLVRGLPPGKHAVHIHATGSCTPCGAAGGHFDPGPNSNPTPDGNHPFHSGDLINVEVGSNGVGTLITTTSRVTLSAGPLSVFDLDGSAIIVHDLADTYCPAGPVANCAGGARAACGIVQLIP
jgi:Cu-Zn family superoxide dismutase